MAQITLLELEIVVLTNAIETDTSNKEKQVWKDTWQH